MCEWESGGQLAALARVQSATPSRRLQGRLPSSQQGFRQKGALQALVLKGPLSNPTRWTDKQYVPSVTGSLLTGRRSAREGLVSSNLMSSPRPRQALLPHYGPPVSVTRQVQGPKGCDAVSPGLTLTGWWCQGGPPTGRPWIFLTKLPASPGPHCLAFIGGKRALCVVKRQYLGRNARARVGRQQPVS